MSYDIIVTSKTMGGGDTTLAENLMLAFINTLTQKDNLPDHMWFYGDGAFLTALGSEALEDLESLVNRGVDIKTCGTCVNYYELEEDIKVGEITTMSAFVDLFASSQKLVFPA